MAKKKPGARESSNRPGRVRLDLCQHPEKIARSSRGDRPITPTAGCGSGANLGFEAQLWAAANALRGGMDAAEYKDVALGLVFPKYISDAFEARHAAVGAGRRGDADPEIPALPARRCEKRQAGQGDSFLNNRFPDLKADLPAHRRTQTGYILPDPPFNMPEGRDGSMKARYPRSAGACGEPK